MTDQADRKGILGWFATNHVAANLLMLLIVASGILTVLQIKFEIFPEYTLDMVSVSVPYRGATPSDVEDGVILRVEEAVAGIDGVKRITSNAMEGVGTTLIEVEDFADVTEVLDDVKAAVDRITTFPEETEKPVIAEVKTYQGVISIVVYGDVTEKTLRQTADRIRDDLTRIAFISQVDVSGIRKYEISIEVSEETLRRYGLSFDQLAAIVRNSSLDIPAGSVKTEAGEILVRTEGQKYYGYQFERIRLLTRPDGTKLRLGDIAIVRDGFEDTDLFSTFDGKPAAFVNVSRTGDQDSLEIAEAVKQYVKEKQDELPTGVSLALWQDDSEILKSRISLLERNAILGLILVFLCLTLFLDLRLAFWTTLGIPISFLGAFWLMPVFDISINMISLFALIMSLGIVVDDAIVVGENIYNYRQQGMKASKAAIQGVKEMSVPVVLAVLTTIFAFLPLAYTTGILGKILRVLPIVVSCVLAISLVEALFILPAHLCSKLNFGRSRLTGWIDRIREWVGRHLKDFVNGPFERAVELAVRWRYVTLSIGLAAFLITIGFVIGGYIKFVFFDPVEADFMIASVEMPLGTPVERTREVARKLEKVALQVCDEFQSEQTNDVNLLKHLSTTIGGHPFSDRGGGPMQMVGEIQAQSHLAEVVVELPGAEKRDVSSMDMMNRWQELVGEIPGTSSLIFESQIVTTGKAVELELSHYDFDTLLAATDDLKDILRQYEAVSEITDSYEQGKPELKLELNDVGRLSGLTLSDLARQVRQGFYGEEVQRIQRGRHDIRVMLRYPEDQRRSLSDIETMRIRMIDGTEIPFRTVAKVRYGTGFSTIKRVDRERVVTVSADVDEKKVPAGEINADLAQNVLPQLMREYRGLSFDFAGEQRERNESLASLRYSFAIALMAIYGILAIQFRSYSQPMIVMSAIPFGIIGAVFGHLLLGFNLSILSLFGIVALSGVVVNDSLILIDLINREREEGVSLTEVIRDSATRRFRPIMLTTLTTFFGLVPMMLERSLQARFLIPMAISLAFGVLFATCITLFLVPSLYRILEDIKMKFLSRFISDES